MNNKSIIMSNLLKKIFKPIFKKELSELKELTEKNEALEKRITENINSKAEDFSSIDEKRKDIDFFYLLYNASADDKSEQEVLGIMANGLNAAFGEDAEVAIFRIQYISESMKSQIGMDLESEDLITDKKIAYCIYDTSLGEDLNQFSDDERSLYLKKNSVLGVTFQTGDGVVEETRTKNDEKVIPLNYLKLEPCRWQLRKIEKGCHSNRKDMKRIGYPMYNMDSPVGDYEIEYIILLNSGKATPFGKQEVRTVRGYETYTTFGLALRHIRKMYKNMAKKSLENLELNRRLIEAFGVAYHSLKGPLSTLYYKTSDLSEKIENNIIPTKEYMQNFVALIERQIDLISTKKSELTNAAIKYDMCAVPFEKFIMEKAKYIYNQNEKYYKRINLQFDIKTRDKYIFVDKRKFEILLYDMLKNTAEQCKEGKKATFKITARYINNAIYCLFLDNAGGMNKDRFQQLRQEGKVDSFKGGEHQGIGTYTIGQYFIDTNSEKYFPVNFEGKGFGHFARLKTTLPDVNMDPIIKTI